MTMIHKPLYPEPVEPDIRKRMSPTLKREIARLQGFKCFLCRAELPFPFHVDHVIPLELGGADDFLNMQALCVACHAVKTREDIKRIRKAARLRRDADPETRRRPVRKIRSRGFQKADPLR